MREENGEGIQTNKPWKSWCRLCAAKDWKSAINKNAKDCGFNSNTVDEKEEMAGTLKRFFGIVLKEHQKEPHKICCPRCLQRLQDIQKFRQQANRVQKMFSELCALEECKEQNWKAVLERYDFIVSGVDCTLESNEKIDNNSNEGDLIPAVTDVDGFEFVTLKEPKPSEKHKMSTIVGNKAIMQDHNNQQDEREQRANKQTLRKKCKLSEKTTSEDLSSGAGRTKHVCQQCSLCYSSAAEYRRHMRQKHGQDIPLSHQCKQCFSSFSTALKLQRHLRTHLPLELKKEFDCCFCLKKFTTPYILEKHISAVHNNEKPYICEECGAALKSGSSLKSHMLTHSDERPIKCELCTKFFKNQVAMKRHMDSHSKQSLICSVCAFEVGTSAKLKRHMIVHSEIKLYKCEICAKQFKRSEAYKHHLLLHTGLKPYACNFCDRSFANGSNCRAHLKKSHPMELAVLEGSEQNLATFTNNAPKLEQLKAMIKTSSKIYQVQTKQRRENKNSHKNTL